MYPTAEVRWFLPGPVPPAVEAWFRRGPRDVEQQPRRTDHYLHLPGSEGLNIKLREGLIEVKQRVGETALTPLHERVTGIVERWRKWSFDLAQPDGARRHVVPASPWIAVQKRRRLRTYQVKIPEDVVAPSTTEPPTQGCEVELTQIDALGQTWWTVAFEAFGEETALRENLLLVARHVLGADEPPSLQASDSRGYAAWLARLAHSEGR